MRFAFGLYVLLVGASAPQEKDLTLDEIIERTERLTAGIPKLPWRTFTLWGDQGYEVFGRWERDVGLRSTIYALSCSDEPTRKQDASPNKCLTIWTREHVSLARLSIMLESNWQPPAPPHLLFRAQAGTPEHGAVDPFQLPADFNLLLHVDEPLAYFQLDPKTMFGHEPDLKLLGRVKFDGKECYALQSERDARDLAKRMPRSWCRNRFTRKTFYIDTGTFYLAGLKVEAENLDAQGGARIGHETITSVVRTRQKPQNRTGKIHIPEGAEAFLPEEVEVAWDHDGLTERFRRRVVVEDCSS